MIAHTLPLDFPHTDLAGDCYPQPNLWQIQKRSQTLVCKHLSAETLGDRLQDLPAQFRNPQPRPWKRLDWQNVDASQIIGIDPLVFLAILAGSADTEEPIRGYTQTSRQYLEPLHPDMARFVGGVPDDAGTLIELGLWEKEERQHAPALQKLYTQLTGLKLRLLSHAPRPYEPTGNARDDLYYHGLHRIATEYGATCLYLWLMAHSTGPLQAVLEELLLDEINHMTKFWGFGRWLFPEASGLKVLYTLGYSAFEKLWKQERHSSLLHTLRRMAQVLHWEAWSWRNQASFVWTFAIALTQLQSWHKTLVPDDLQRLFGSRPLHPIQDPCNLRLDSIRPVGAQGLAPLRR
ncbi:ferritin-like domain-containing protein [Altericista sp. CCNU0014]|uniref:ferritin-like domain-containing protein n=1 Tax=Altericista sp. CCNU0014 TaxID=3082949 RepID=UPI00384D626F